MTPVGLLDLWERVAAADGRTRARTLAAWATAADPEDLSRRPLGDAQLGLLAAWRALLGDSLDAVVDCPACGGALELEIDPDTLPAQARTVPRAVVDDDGNEVVPRLLTPADVDAVVGLDGGEARSELARRAVGVASPSARLQAAVAAVLDEADPASYWWVELSCPSCGHRWEELLDLGAFLWQAVDGATGQLLREVADIAAAFGWSEAAVLELSPPRRAAYLALAVQ